jgi:iron(II)-dependent oxidoreductase
MVPQLSVAREAPPAEDVGAHPEAASPFGVLDLVGNVYEWTDESCDEHTCMAVLRGGSNYRPSGSMWYFPQPGCDSNGGAGGRFCVDPATSDVRGDLGQFNAFLMLSEGMDRSSGIGFRCVADDVDEQKRLEVPR